MHRRQGANIVLSAEASFHDPLPLLLQYDALGDLCEKAARGLALGA